MMKRLTWFTSGVVAGIAAMRYGRRKVRQTADALRPANVAKDAAAKVRERVDEVVDAARQGRAAMREREDELRARTGLAADLSRQPVEPGRVVPLRPLKVPRPGRRRA